MRKSTYHALTTMLFLVLMIATAVIGFFIGKNVAKIEAPAVSPTYSVQTLAVSQSLPSKGSIPRQPQLVSLGTFKVTHYCACSRCCGKSDGITATGTKATAGRTIAVDPRLIPYGTKVLLRYSDGTEHTYRAEDCGGAIKQKRVDVFVESHRAAVNAGVKTAEVFLVKE